MLAVVGRSSAGVRRFRFDLRDTYATGSVPGDPGFIQTNGAYSLMSWWSNWPLNPDPLFAAQVETEAAEPEFLTECQLNRPLVGSTWVRFVNMPAAFGVLPASGSFLVNLILHNEPLRPDFLRELPFSVARVIDVPGLGIGRLSWGPLGTPSGAPLVDFASGYVPYRRLRVRATTPLPLGITATVDFPGLIPVSVPFFGDSTFDPVPQDSGEVVFTSAVVLVTPVRTLLWFDSV